MAPQKSPDFREVPRDTQDTYMAIILGDWLISPWQLPNKFSAHSDNILLNKSEFVF